MYFCDLTLPFIIVVIDLKSIKEKNTDRASIFEGFLQSSLGNQFTVEFSS